MLVAYTALRLLLFVVPFLVIWAVSGNPTLSAVFAAVIGLSLSVILLDPQRRALARLVGDDEAMSTAEYAIGTIAAAAFAALLYTVISGDSVVGALTGIITRALSTTF